MGRIWIRCLSVRQPYANLIAQGRKTIEVRTWEPYWPKEPEPLMEFWNDILIVSAKKPSIAPAGCAVATCRVGLSQPFEWFSAEERELARLPHGYFKSFEERQRAYGWPLAQVVRLFDPFPVRGRLGLWWENVDEGSLRGALADAWRRVPPGMEEEKR